ncbi:MAG: amidohydrolase/deacetylase family metallohydrolase [Candidatus Acidiferrales bacterium]
MTAHRHHHHSSMDRRTFVSTLGVGSSLVLSLAKGGENLVSPQRGGDPGYSLLVKGGRVIDPSQGISDEQDVAISGSKVARVAKNIPETDAQQILDARGKIVTPGLIDLHVHVYDGVVPYGIPPDPNCIAKGVTTVVDAGSAGAHTFPGFRRSIINLVSTRVYALLNISVIGQASHSVNNQWGELLEIRYANPKLAIATIEKNRDVIMGIKVRLGRNLSGENDMQALKLAREAADAVELPIMVHIGGTTSPLPDILSMLKKRDIVTHCYRAGDGGTLDDNGRVLPAVFKARERGVHFDVGHGVGSFSFDVAEKAMKQDLYPGTISSDLHQLNYTGPVFDLATTLSKFMILGMTLEQVIERASTNAARTFDFPQGFGTLREGAEADVAIFELREGKFDFIDSEKQTRTGRLKLFPVATVKSGQIYGGPTDVVPS